MSASCLQAHTMEPLFTAASVIALYQMASCIGGLCLRYTRGVHYAIFQASPLRILAQSNELHQLSYVEAHVLWSRRAQVEQKLATKVDDSNEVGMMVLSGSVLAKETAEKCFMLSWLEQL